MSSGINRPIGKGCELCLFEHIEEYEQDYVNRRRTVNEIIAALRDDNVEATKYLFYNHMRTHVKPEVALVFSKNAELLAKEIVDDTGEFIEEIERMKGKIEAIENSINAEAHPSLIKAYTGMVSEFRRLVEGLVKLRGDFKTSSHIHVKNLNVEYNNVIGQVMQDACPSCKAKLAKTLEPLILKPSNT